MRSNPKQFAPCTSNFSRALSELQVIARNCDWFIALVATVVIGRGNCFGLGLSITIENRSKVSSFSYFLLLLELYCGPCSYHYDLEPLLLPLLRGQCWPQLLKLIALSNFKVWKFNISPARKSGVDEWLIFTKQGFFQFQAVYETRLSPLNFRGF